MGSAKRTLGVSVFCAGAMVAVMSTAAQATTWSVPGDGSNGCIIINPNCNTIAQAVTAAINGDTISIGAGTFSGAGNQTIVLTKSLTITGAGRTSTFITPTATYGFSVRANNITISDLALQGGTVGVLFSNAASDNTQLSRIDFSANSTRGIDFNTTAVQPVTNVVIDDCAFATPNIGIRMGSNSQVTGLTITNSSFTGNAYGIYQANDGNTSRLVDFELGDTTFTNNTSYAIYAEEMRDAVIEDSVFTNNRVGIGLLKFYSAALAASNITIQNNTFTQTLGSALDLEIYATALENPINILNNTITLDVTALTSNVSAIFVMLTHTIATHAAVNITGNEITLSGTFGTATAAHAVRLRRNGPVVLTGNILDGGDVGGTATTPATSGLYVEAGATSGVMPASATITATCNRITGFQNGVSVYSTAAPAGYGGLVAGATVTLNDNDILGNGSAGVVNGALSETVDAQSNWWGCPAGPGNPGCDGVSGAVDASSPAAASEPCAPCANTGQCDDSNPCTVDACAGSCTNAPGNAGASCRAAAGVCDLAETCDGVAAACPADGKSTASCRASAGACDLAETCDGVGNDCPADVKSTAVCRAAGDVCDVAESCDGVADTCPADGVATAGTSCRGAAGVCDLAETCDGVATACPSDAKSTAECRASAGACDAAELCNGVADACPSDAAQPDGSSCSDGAYCNGAELCASGVCQTGSAPCGLLCNEGTDACESGCQPAPQTCRAATKSLLLVKDKADNTKDKLTWKWIKGASTTQMEFGDPTDDTDYALCIYAGTASSLVGEAILPASMTTWSVLGSAGYKDKDPSGTPDGITKATLKGNAQNKAKAIVKGKGDNLPDLTLPVTGVVTVQLVNGSTGLCFGAEYQPAQQLKNELGLLKAKAQ